MLACMNRSLTGIFCAAVLLVSVAGQSFAADNRTCYTPSFMAQLAAYKHPNDKILHLTDALAAGFMKQYNALPPVSDYKATEAMFVFHANSRVGRIAFFEDGCVVAGDMLPISLIRKMLDELRDV